MDRDEYNALKESGGFVTDAALQEQQETNIVVDDEEEFRETDTDEQEDSAERSEDEQEDDLPPLSEKEKTAFEKRMERERVKLQEKLQAEMKQQYEQQYGKHKAVIDLLGGDPEVIEKRIRESQMLSEANRLAEQNGWDDEQTRWYVEQQKQQQELKELRVQMQINRLKDNPEYSGIGSMEREIVSKIDKSGGALTVEEAYWALGGPKRIEQIRLEAQMRESVKRQQQPRTVLTDAATPSNAEKPLPADVLRDAERAGMSAAEARRLMNSEPAKDLAEWRKRRQQTK